jgi:hypothetical protein
MMIRGPSTNSSDRERVVRVMVIVEGQAVLLEIVSALHSPSGFASRLHGREKQRDQDPNDCNYHQQLDQRETTPIARVSRHDHTPKKDRRKELAGFQISLCPDRRDSNSH